jgi:hypothetical protein
MLRRWGAGYTANQQTVGIVLANTFEDDSAGLSAIKMRGGVAIIQIPKSKLYHSWAVAIST